MVQTDSVDKEKILVICGPTCVGKSDFAVDAAKKYDGEIIGVGSVQVYKLLDIGSGKITREEMRGVPHYLIDVKMPDESFSVVDFLNEAKPLITDIISRGKLPIIVGGTGFYINALLHGYKCGGSAPDKPLRIKLKKTEVLLGDGALYDALSRTEPELKSERADLFRTVRRFERAMTPPYGEYIDVDEDEEYDALLVVMDADRAKLEEKAAARIEKMFAAGLLDEVRSLKMYHKFRCMQSVGYKSVLLGLSNDMSDDEIKTNMRQEYHDLIKKQQTFFRWIKWSNKYVLYNWDYAGAEKAIKEFITRGLR